MDLRRLPSLVLALLGASSACTISDDSCGSGQTHDFRCSVDPDPEDTDSATDSDSDACLDGDDPVSLRVENRTGNAIEVVYFVRCDGTEPSEFPLMPPGLANGDDVEIPMPGPGRWLLDYSGEGCEGDMPHETAMEVCAGATYVWTPDDLHHVCVG